MSDVKQWAKEMQTNADIYMSGSYKPRQTCEIALAAWKFIQKKTLQAKKIFSLFQTLKSPFCVKFRLNE